MPYLYGWDGGGLQNNHHAYDVVRIVNQTAQTDRTQQSVAKALLMLLTARSLAMSIDGGGAFDVAQLAGEAYYFGLSFFVESGLLGRTASSEVKVTNKEGLIAGIGRNLDALDASDPHGSCRPQEARAAAIDAASGDTCRPSARLPARLCRASRSSIRSSRTTILCALRSVSTASAVTA